jgi:hypothetical protein
MFAQTSCYSSATTYCDYPASSTHDPSKTKVLYVDHFLRFNSNNQNLGVNEAISILGVDDNQDQIYEVEDVLLNYAQNNGYNGLILYDCFNIW